MLGAVLLVCSLIGNPLLSCRSGRATRFADEITLRYVSQWTHMLDSTLAGHAILSLLYLVVGIDGALDRTGMLSTSQLCRLASQRWRDQPVAWPSIDYTVQDWSQHNASEFYSLSPPSRGLASKSFPSSPSPRVLRPSPPFRAFYSNPSIEVPPTQVRREAAHSLVALPLRMVSLQLICATTLNVREDDQGSSTVLFTWRWWLCYSGAGK